MADPSIFDITNGEVAFTLVDKTVPGYADTWQAPGGKDVDTVVLADYADAVGKSWTCQVTAGALTPEPSTTTTDVPATFCSPARTVPQPGETGYTLDLSFLQDPHIKTGLSRWLFEQDTFESYFFLGFDTINPPKAIGRLRVQAGAIGGEARTTLTADISLPLSRKPQIAFGDINDAEAVPPTAPVVPPANPATGAVAGTPGSWTPAGATPPATVADLIADVPNAVNAVPNALWATGESVVCADAQDAYFDGTDWVAGIAP